jgi:hypothetical protein
MVHVKRKLGSGAAIPPFTNNDGVPSERLKPDLRSRNTHNKPVRRTKDASMFPEAQMLCMTGIDRFTGEAQSPSLLTGGSLWGAERINHMVTRSKASFECRVLTSRDMEYTGRSTLWMKKG